MGSSLGYGQAAPGNYLRDPLSRHRLEPGSLAALRSVLAPRHDDDRSLSTLIESEIIPRLMVANGGMRDATIDQTDDRDSADQITQAEIAALAPLALQIEADELLEYADRILGRGVPVSNLLVDLLAPAARLLGEYWEQDRCDFVDVTMGLWRLQEVVHEVAGRASLARRLGAAGRRALFAVMPGDQHSFGTVVIDEVFCREGWMTDRLGEGQASDLLDRVAGTWFDLVGLTVSCDSHTANLTSLITALRNVSRNPRVRVMVGGRVFVEQPDLANQVGADGTAPDAKVALTVADDLVGAIERECLPCG
jgi:methanogenic corrinoid protein MtbC1